MRANGGCRWTGVAAAILATALGAGCGSGGGDAPKAPEGANLYVKSFSAPNYNGVFLDEDLQFVLSAPVRDDSINPDSLQIRTGPGGGISPYGVYVRGVFMVDPGTGSRAVIDAEGITPNRLNNAEKTGNLTLIPEPIRIDLGYDMPRGRNGLRQPVFDRSQRHVVTFVPEVPTRAALDDTGFTPGATYSVIVPGYPSTNTLENLNGAQLLSPNNRVFTSTFTVVPGTSAQLFIGAESAGIPRIIHSVPFNGDSLVAVTSTIAIRFSQPLDPRTVTPDKFKVEMISVPAPYPQVPVSVFLAQQRLGKVEVILTPINPMPPDATIRVTVDSGIEDLLGQGMNQSVISFFTGAATQPFSGPVEEHFLDTSRMDGALTSANWAASKPYVGSVPGQLTAAFAPYAGDGTDGAFTASVGSTVNLDTGTSVQRVYNFTSFSIPIGAKVVAVGNYPLVVHCQGTADISGELVLDGSDGGNGLRGDVPGGAATGGAPGAGGPGGNRGGAGAFATTGAGGNIDGIDGPGGGLGGFTGQNDAFPATVVVASTGVSVAADTFTYTNHFLTNGVRVRVTTTGTHPGGLAAGTDYYVAGATANTFQLSATNGGSAIDLTSQGSGNHSVVPQSNTFWPRLRADGTPQTCDKNPTTGQPYSYTACRQREGGGGGGYVADGSNADNQVSTQLSRNGSTFPNGGTGGPLSGDDTISFASQNASVEVKDPATGGTRIISLTGIPTLVFGHGGFGGGGGGGEDDTDANGNLGTADGSDEGGGGGGGGGGAFQLVAYGNINIAGKITADGGNGGNSFDDVVGTNFSQGAGGGGGSGGTLFLQSHASLTVQLGAILSVAGGVGGQGLADGTTTVFTAGTGADGRIRLEDADGNVPNAPAASSVGSFAPTLDLASVAVSQWQNTGIFAPDFLQPEIDANTFPAQPYNGKIRVFLEGAQEDVDTVPDDPDTATSTGWIKVYDSELGGLLTAGSPWDALDINKWWRFKVEFDVDANHTFVDPLPMVDRILIDIAE